MAGFGLDCRSLNLQGHVTTESGKRTEDKDVRPSLIQREHIRSGVVERAVGDTDLRVATLLDMPATRWVV